MKAVELYNSGLSMAECGKILSLSSATILRILNSYGISKRTKGGIYKIPEDEIVYSYLNGNSCNDIAKKYQVSFHSISNILEKHNIPRNNKYHNLNLDEDYFQNIDRVDKAYFLGLILTDGNVSKNTNSVSLTLASNDSYILDVFSCKTGNENKISHRKDERHDEKTFKVKCAKWKNDLEKYSIVPQKTFISNMPIIKDEFMPHLIRGMFDGDGWITYKSQTIGFYGNEQTVNNLRDYLVDKLNVYQVKVMHPNKNLWQVGWSSKKDIKKIGDYIYENKEDCYLQRKYANYLKIIHGNTELTC